MFIFKLSTHRSKLIFSIAFGAFQFKGWKEYYNQGNAVKSFITFVYGQYGQSYKVYNGNYPIEYNGEDYVYQGKVLDETSINNLKSFLRQICGYGSRFEGSKLKLLNYGDPYTLYDVNNKKQLEINSIGLSLNGEKISEGHKDE